jgi:hypothetical protein
LVVILPQKPEKIVIENLLNLQKSNYAFRVNTKRNRWKKTS